MPSDFRGTLVPLSILAQFFGFEVLEYPTGRLRPKLTVLYSGLLWSTFAFGFIYMRRIISDNCSNPSLIDLMYVLSIALSFVSTCFMARNVKLYRKCLSEIVVLNDTLETLGRAKDYHNFRNTSIKYIFCWLLANCFLDIWEITYHIVQSDASYLLFLCCPLDFALHATSIVSMQYYILFRYAASRFDCIYEVIEEILANDEIRIGSGLKERSQSFRRVIPQDEKRQRILWTSIHAHLKLCNILWKLNKLFEVQICLIIIYGFFHTLCNFIFVYVEILSSNCSTLGKFHNGLIFLAWTTSYIFKSLTPNHICDVVTFKAARIKRITERVLVLLKDPMRKDLSVFLLRAYHRPLRLSAMGLFDFGYEFVYQFFASAMTALVIMLQLNSSTASLN